jgi:hypothetical protein
MPESAPLWTCPKCGHQFVTRNLSHSCGRYELSDHFQGRDAILRRTFDRLVKVAGACGPVTVYAQKTRIVFMVRVRFASVVVRKTWLDLGLWTSHRVAHPLVQRTEVFGPATYYPHFRLERPEQIDPALAELIAEVYRERL